MNKKLVEEFVKMNPEDLRIFVEADKQESFADDSPIRLLLQKHTLLGDSNAHYPFSFALNEMYIALTYALYKKYNMLLKH